MHRFRTWFHQIVKEGLLQYAQNAFNLTKAMADAFQESNAPLYPLNVLLSNEQAQSQVHWVHQRQIKLEEQAASNPNENNNERSRYRHVRHVCRIPKSDL